MAELGELRIRLEGALETVESATAGMLVATEALQQGVASELVDAMTESASDETKQALAAIERLSEHDPALVPVIRRFTAAREALRARVLFRGAELGLVSMPVERIVAVLAKYPVLHEGTALRGRSLAFGAAALVASLTLGWLHPLLFVAPAVLALVGVTIISVTDVESLLIAERLDAPRNILRFRLRGGGVVEVGLNQLPPKFIAALERVTNVERQ